MFTHALPCACLSIPRPGVPLGERDKRKSAVGLLPVRRQRWLEGTSSWCQARAERRRGMKVPGALSTVSLGPEGAVEPLVRQA